MVCDSEKLSDFVILDPQTLESISEAICSNSTQDNLITFAKISIEEIDIEKFAGWVNLFKNILWNLI
jgi:hypothetical protein